MVGLPDLEPRKPAIVDDPAEHTVLTTTGVPDEVDLH